MVYTNTSMKIILGQGNPGAQYTSSRHNVGFMALDYVASQKGVTFTKKPKFHADIAEYSVAGEKILLVKPTTFYNETGQSARLLSDFYKANPATDVLVIHDDLSLPLGTIRIREKGSDAGNNGIKSLNAHLGPAYRRVRVGIANDLRVRMNDADFVLSLFSKLEAKAMQSIIIPKISELVDQFCVSDVVATSHSLLADA